MVYIAVECIMGDLGWILIVCFLNLGLLVVDRAVFFCSRKFNRRSAVLWLETGPSPPSLWDDLTAADARTFAVVYLAE